MSKVAAGTCVRNSGLEFLLLAGDAQTKDPKAPRFGVKLQWPPLPCYSMSPPHHTSHTECVTARSAAHHAPARRWESRFQTPPLPVRAQLRAARIAPRGGPRGTSSPLPPLLSCSSSDKTEMQRTAERSALSRAVVQALRRSRLNHAHGSGLGTGSSLRGRRARWPQIAHCPAATASSLTTCPLPGSPSPPGC